MKEACTASYHSSILVTLIFALHYLKVKVFKILQFTFDLVVGIYYKSIDFLLQNGKIPDDCRSLFYERS